MNDGERFKCPYEIPYLGTVYSQKFSKTFKTFKDFLMSNSQHVNIILFTSKMYNVYRAPKVFKSHESH